MNNQPQPSQISPNPKLIMLCGVPTSGKSTYSAQLLSGLGRSKANSTTVLSTDSYIEQQAQLRNSTYNELFDSLVGDAISVMNLALRVALRNNNDIIWDQTNLTVKSRKRKLAKIPSRYEKVAVWFEVTKDEALRRNQLRPGKIIPEQVLLQMLDSFTPPTKSEGFDQIIRPLA